MLGLHEPVYQKEELRCSPDDPILQVELYNSLLWDQFAKVGTEIIITKSGR